MRGLFAAGLAAVAVFLVGLGVWSAAVAGSDEAGAYRGMTIALGLIVGLVALLVFLGGRSR